ncbi:MAG: hypothetical protein ACK5LZ_01585 [Anaerorhabdus sp.]
MIVIVTSVIGMFMLSWIWIGITLKDVKSLKELPLTRKIVSVSYFGKSEELKKIGKDYSWGLYMKHSVIITLLAGTLAFLTFRDYNYTVIIVGCIVFVWPYLYCLRIHHLYQQEKIEALFIYCQSILIYLKENRTAQQTLSLTKEIVPYQLQEDIQMVLNFIEETENFNDGLAYFEERYPFAMIKNTHILLVGKRNLGTLNMKLMEYLQESIENHEQLLREFYLKKAANQKVFIILWLLNLFSILLIVDLFSVSSGQTQVMKLLLLLFYGINIATLVIYERWCFRKKHLD